MNAYYFFRGYTISLGLQITTVGRNPVPIDITTFVGTIAVFIRTEGGPLIPLTVAPVTPTLGTVTATLENTLIPPGKYNLQVEYTNETGDIVPSSIGVIQLVPSVRYG